MRLEVVKTGDEESGRKPSIPNTESFGKDEERKRSRQFGRLGWSGLKMWKQIDEAFEGAFELKASKNCTSCSVSPPKSSR